MAEKPILFSTAMVRAIQSGSKTQTRRMVSGAPTNAGCAAFSQPSQKPGQSAALFFEGPTPRSRGLKSVNNPYGVPGDHLWVRETWNALYDTPYDSALMYHHELGAELARYYTPKRILYRAGPEEGFTKDDVAEGNEKWLPSIHMPRRFARLLLEITGVRLERLQGISNVDAISEGVLTLGQAWVDAQWPEYAAERDRVQAANQALTAQGQRMGLARPPIGPTPRDRFQALWEQINGKEAWTSNPWVWVVEYQVVTP